MHPASSMIAFTVLSGSGFGAFFWHALLREQAHPGFVFVAGAMVVIGLFCSMFHIKHKRRAWRGFTQWRSSWLSREAVLAVAMLPLLLWLFILSIIGADTPYVLRFLLIVGSAATVFCTSMIYASLRSIFDWFGPTSNRLFLAHAAFGGWMVLAVFSPSLSRFDIILSLIAAVSSLYAHIKWKQRTESQTDSSPESATMLGHIGRVTALAPPHTQSSYLLDEMGFKIARKRRQSLMTLAFALTALLPVIMLVIASVLSWPWLAVLGLLTHLIGAVAGRWLFFATARHAVMNYY